MIHRNSWPTRQVAKTATFEHIEGFFNSRRRHSALGHLCLAEFEEVRLEEEDAVRQRCVYRTGTSPQLICIVISKSCTLYKTAQEVAK